MIEVREARYFIAVAEQLNFGRAAESLHMSQPPLSAAIKALEKRLGVLLLHRTTREVQLTGAGAVFLDQCRLLVAAAADADSAARQAAEGLAGELRIGAVTSAFMDTMTTVLRAYRHTHPAVTVRVREINTHNGVRMVQRRELDLVLARQLSTPRGCRRTMLKREPFVLAAPADWQLPEGIEDDLTLGADLPWVWIPRERTPDYHDEVAACCRAAGFTPQAQHTALAIDSQVSMVATGLGVALVPESTTARYGARVRTVRLTKTTTIELAAVCRAPANRLVTDFLTALERAPW